MSNVISVCWNITSACNLPCSFCYRVKHQRTLVQERWAEVVKKIADSGAKRLVISGGEPLLIPNIEKLFDLAKNAGLITSLITNGSLLNQQKILSYEGTLDEIVLSIDGGDKFTHSQMREVNEDHFDLLLQHLYHMMETSIRRRVNTVISQKNIHSIKDLLSILLSLSVSEWRLLQFYPMNDALFSFDAHNIGIEEVNALESELRNLMGNKDLIITVGTNETMSGSYFSLSPNGQVFTSNQGKVVWLGHILNASIQDMIKDQSFDQNKHTAQYQIVENFDV